MRKITMETIFGNLPKEYIVSPEHLACCRMIFGKRYMGYGLGPAQRDFIRFWLRDDPENVPDQSIIPAIFEHGMSGYAPDFEEPSLDANKFDIGDWLRCREFWVKSLLHRRFGAPLTAMEPARYDDWLEIWGVFYQRRIEAEHKED